MKSYNNKITIALLSGGLDSATATALALESGKKVIGLSFDYGQRHKRELKAANALAHHFKLEEHHTIKVDLGSWGGSSLTDLGEGIPENGLNQDKIPNTYVPGRNTVFIAIGLSLAEARKANELVLGINAIDYSGYPDCRPNYLNAYQTLADLSSKAAIEGNTIKLWAPLIHLNKVEIVKEAIRLNIPIDLTWSCYNGRNEPCGVCDSCRIRNSALHKAGYRPDTTNKQI